MATYSLKNDSDSGHSCSEYFSGYEGKWSTCSSSNGLKMVKIDGNHCTSWISKVIAYISAFFDSGKIVEVTMPTKDGQIETHTFWTEKEVTSQKVLTLESSKTSLFFFKKLSYILKPRSTL